MKNFPSFKEYLLLEANKSLIRQLEREFTYDVVHSENVYVFSTQIAQRISNFMDKAFFNKFFKKISKPTILICNSTQYFIKLMVEYGYSEIDANIKANDFGYYIPEVLWYKNNSNQVVSVVKRECIGINTDKMNYDFISGCSLILHEMIHRYDYYNGELSDLWFQMKVLGKKIDPHTTPTFMKKEAEAENVGLNVKPSLNEHVSYTKSKGFEKRNMSLIQESDLSGYEFIGRDCMVTV